MRQAWRSSEVLSLRSSKGNGGSTFSEDGARNARYHSTFSAAVPGTAPAGASGAAGNSFAWRGTRSRRGSRVGAEGGSGGDGGGGDENIDAMMMATDVWDLQEEEEWEFEEEVQRLEERLRKKVKKEDYKGASAIRDKLDRCAECCLLRVHVFFTGVTE